MTTIFSYSVKKTHDTIESFLKISLERQHCMISKVLQSDLDIDKNQS